MTKLTPMLQQFFSIKEKYPDAVLFFRMGDFYEMFFEDAVKAAPVLEIALTSRSKFQDEDIPMCGVPHHAVDMYINRLISKGIKVAICDQMEDPRLAKGIVAREVTRVVTPGMVISPDIDEPKNTRYLAAIVGSGPDSADTRYGLAAIEVSTGEFLATEVTGRRGLIHELTRLNPAETLLSPEDESGLADAARELGLYVTEFDPVYFTPGKARSVLSDHFGHHALIGFGLTEMPWGMAAAGAALLYAQENQGRDLTHVDRLQAYQLENFMVLDESTKRNLELEFTLRDRSRSGSLLGLMDLTVTAMGGRKLRSWLTRPLIDRLLAAERHEAVETLVLDGLRRQDLREQLAGVHDLERIVGRISLNRAGPRDITALKSSLLRLPAVKRLLTESAGLVRELGQNLDDLSDLAGMIDAAVVDDPPLSLKEGGVFKVGHHPELDDLIQIMSDGKGWIARMERDERAKTGISSLKVGYNRIFGYYIEVTRPNLPQVPENYIRKQTVANGERFITPELKEQEDKVLSAGDRRVTLEQKLFEELRGRIAREAARLRNAADLLAQADVLAGLAELAMKNDYVRPELLDEDVIEIRGGRHPVIEQMLKNEPFVPNDLYLDNEKAQVLIVTGPNMAGKSTILRQAALIALMAQMGSFVPAESARLGLVDRIFTRVGASDDLTRGRSTFMVEMNETAQILNQATPRSLIILDEIGRGTSTFDGLSIAWAVAEYLHDLAGRGVRTLFATHYHELVQLAETKPRVKNFNVAVKEWNQSVIFLRKLVPGGTSRSYGLAVARLAGLPGEVLARAAEVLENLENSNVDVTGSPKLARSRKKTPGPSQLSLFKGPDDGVLTDAVTRLEVETMTPLDALNKLAELKRMVS